MTVTSSETSLPLNRLTLHFDVDSHSLPLSHFIESAKSAENIIANLNDEFFGGKLSYQVRVFTPQEGGLLEFLGITITGGFTLKLIWEFLESEIGKAYIKGLTGHDPAHWAEKAGEKTLEYLQDEGGGPPTTSPNQGEKSSNTDTLPEHEEKKQVLSVILVQSTQGFIKMSPEELQTLGITKTSFRRAYVSRNKIYQGCLDNKEVKGLGFDTSQSFPLTRVDFEKYIVEIPLESEEEPDSEQKWVIDTPDIVVNSPNWKRDGRKWQASTSQFNDIAFTVEDEEFWHHVNLKDIKPDFNDNMRVQWAYPKGSLKPANVRVLKVLSYNGKQLSQPLSMQEATKILDGYSIEETQKQQIDLFND